MGKKRLSQVILFLSGLVFIFSCGEPEVTFDQPQPKDASDIPYFPSKLRGVYISTLDSSILTVTDKQLIRTYAFRIILPKQKLDTSYVLIGDSLVMEKRTNEKTKVLVSNDSIFYQFISVDTFFSISQVNVFRKMKGYYFLNYNHADKVWTVEKISEGKHQISISSIGTNEDIDKLNEITNTKLDSNNIHIPYNPTRKQFRKFVMQSGFSDEETFVKIRGEHYDFLYIPPKK